MARSRSFRASPDRRNSGKHPNPRPPSIPRADSADMVGVAGVERWARIGYTHSAFDFEAFQPRVSTALWKLLYEGNPELAFTRLP